MEHLLQGADKEEMRPPRSHGLHSETPEGKGAKFWNKPGAPVMPILTLALVPIFLWSLEVVSGIFPLIQAYILLPPLL
jgi:hypothetical protein